MRASRSRSSARRARRRLRRARRVCVVIMAVILCCATMFSLAGQPDATPANNTTVISDRATRELVSTDPNFPIYTDPSGTYVPIETITPEITAIFTIDPSCSEFSPEPVTSPRSVELVAAMRAEALRSTPLLDVPLDAELQYRVFTELCDENPEFFALIMAIAENESCFVVVKIGDNGLSYGIVQINIFWHSERMAKFGITDPEQLFDPYLCMQVGLDYLYELMQSYQGSTEVTHYLFALYNAGPGQANKWWREGITSTMYSRHVMPTYERYLAAVNQRLAEVESEFSFF